MDGDMWQEWGHVVGCCLADCGSMWQGWWQGVAECGRGGVCGRGVRPMTWMGTCRHVAGCGGGMWQGVGACLAG